MQLTMRCSAMILTDWIVVQQGYQGWVVFDAFKRINTGFWEFNHGATSPDATGYMRREIL